MINHPSDEKVTQVELTLKEIKILMVLAEERLDFYEDDGGWYPVLHLENAHQKLKKISEFFDALS